MNYEDFKTPNIEHRTPNEGDFKTPNIEHRMMNDEDFNNTEYRTPNTE